MSKKNNMANTKHLVDSKRESFPIDKITRENLKKISQHYSISKAAAVRMAVAKLAEGV